jgi:hypothetical protein
MNKKCLSIVLFILISLSVTSFANPKEETFDVDLTVLSSTMVYAEVLNMMTNPDDYIGKTIKVSGLYAVSLYLGEYYHFVLVEGVDACCPEGLMFILNGDHSFPDDYPEEMTQIEFAGVFGSYEGFDFPYYYLDVDDFIILQES